MSNLLEALNDWTIHLINKQSTDVTYIDSSKAFDTVNHVKIFEKLKAVGLTGNVLKWIVSFWVGISSELELALHILKH